MDGWWILGLVLVIAALVVIYPRFKRWYEKEAAAKAAQAREQSIIDHPGAYLEELFQKQQNAPQPYQLDQGFSFKIEFHPFHPTNPRIFKSLFPEITAWLQRPDPERQIFAIDLVHHYLSMGRKSSKTETQVHDALRSLLDGIAGVLDDPDYGVRCEAIYVLSPVESGSYLYYQQVLACYKAHGRGPELYYEKYLSSALAFAYQHKLEEMFWLLKETLLPQLTNHSAGTRRSIVYIFSSLQDHQRSGEHSTWQKSAIEPIFAAFITLLHDPDESIRQAVIAWITSFHVTYVLEALAALVKSPYENNRETAYELYARYGERCDCVTQIFDGLQDLSPQVQYAALNSLDQVKGSIHRCLDSDQVVTELLSFLRSDSENFRHAAARVIAELYVSQKIKPETRRMVERNRKIFIRSIPYPREDAPTTRGENSMVAKDQTLEDYF